MLYTILTHLLIPKSAYHTALLLLLTLKNHRQVYLSLKFGWWLFQQLIRLSEHIYDQYSLDNPVESE